MGPYRPPRLEVEGSSPTWTREEWYPLHHGDDISSHVLGGQQEGGTKGRRFEVTVDKGGIESKGRAIHPN
jgi:hypothetical protein